MEYKVLYRKYRPQNFNEIVGQKHIMQILINSIKNDKIAHAYIFTGPRGTGKTSTAKIFAKTLNCLDIKEGISCDKCLNCTEYNSSPDIIEIDAASNNGVENIREIIENIEIAPTNSKYKIYIIDEVHMLSNSAWNAFLKTLEEPPKNVIFILATTDIQKVPITVLSRCQRFDFTRIDNEQIISKLEEICLTEKIKYEGDVLDEIAYLSDGCMRDALSMLDQLSKTNDVINVDNIKETYGTVGSDEIDKIYYSIIQNDIDSLQETITKIKSSGIDVKILINKMLDSYLQKAIEIKQKKISSTGFNQLKKLIETLNELYYKITYSNNGFLLLNLELISFINDGENNLSTRDINKIMENAGEISVEKILNKKKEHYILDDKFIDIRINNSFVGANKESKKKVIQLWTKFREYVNEQMLKEYIVLMDANPQVCSDDYILFTIKSDSLKRVGNSKIYELENAFSKFAKSDYKIIFITEKDWNRYLKTYDKTKKYIIIDESEYINKDDLYTMAEDVFGEHINIE